jgi:hypothetical protein
MEHFCCWISDFSSSELSPRFVFLFVVLVARSDIRMVPTTHKQECDRLGSHLSLLGAAEASLRHLKLEGSDAHLPARPGPPAHQTQSVCVCVCAYVRYRQSRTTVQIPRLVQFSRQIRPTFFPSYSRWTHMQSHNKLSLFLSLPPPYSRGENVFVCV